MKLQDSLFKNISMRNWYINLIFGTDKHPRKMNWRLVILDRHGLVDPELPKYGHNVCPLK